MASLRQHAYSIVKDPHRLELRRVGLTHPVGCVRLHRDFNHMQQSSSLPSWNTSGAGSRNVAPPARGEVKFQRPCEKRKINLRYSGPSARRHTAEGNDWRSPQPGQGRVTSKKSKRGSAPAFGEAKMGKRDNRKGNFKTVRDDESMML